MSSCVVLVIIIPTCFVVYAVVVHKIFSKKIKINEAKIKETEAQLIQMEKMASLGTLAAGVAHEINNPLSFLISNLESLVEQVELGRQREGLQVNVLEEFKAMTQESLEGAQRIKKIVADLKTFSRRSEAKRVSLDVNQVLEFTISLAWNEIKYKVDLVKDYQATSAVLGDPNELSQVFLNIIINAVQAIEEKGAIMLSTYEDAENVYVKISDTGCGIAPDVLPRIFDPFFSTKKGVGLGLSVSYNIIKHHKGDIKVESKIGKGTSFTIELPIGGDNEAGQLGREEKI